MATNGQKASTRKLLKGFAKRLTLHPAFPLVRLLSIEESKVLVGSLDGPQSCEQSQDRQEGKEPGIELLLLFKPEARPVGNIHECHRSAHDKEWPVFVADPGCGVELTYRDEVSIPTISKGENQTCVIRIIPERWSSKAHNGDDEEVKQ